MNPLAHSRKPKTFSLLIDDRAPDAVTAERAHDDALEILSQGAFARTGKNGFAASVPDWAEHERSGHPYFIDIDFASDDLTEARSLRAQAIEAIEGRAEIVFLDELWPCRLRDRYESLRPTQKAWLKRHELATPSRPPNPPGRLAILALALFVRAKAA